MTDTQKQKVYRHTGQYAISANPSQLEQYKQSHQLNIDCKDAIAREINENYDGRRLSTDGRKVVEKYGYERVNWVLANTINQHHWDGRISDDNKQWAKKFPIPEDEFFGGRDRRVDFSANCSTGLISILSHEVRKSYEKSKEKNPVHPKRKPPEKGLER